MGNPVGQSRPPDGRIIDFRRDPDRDGASLQGLFMSNPQLPESDPLHGSFALSALPGDGRITYLRGWPAAKWWASPMLFWDDFTDDGSLGPEPAQRNTCGALCLPA